MKKPNIVLVVADQWRADSIGYTGNTATVTPNIDELVEEGVAFSNAYCQLPVCVPSRSSFLSGWYPHTKGFRTMHHLMGDEDPNLLRTLKENGYHVYWGGRNDVLRLDADVDKYCDTRNDKYLEMFSKMRELKEKQTTIPVTEENKEHDYSHYRGIIDNPNNPDKLQIDNAIEFLNNKVYGDDPFCVYLALALPHPPYQVGEEFYNQINKGRIPAPTRLTEEEWEAKPSILRGIRENQKLYNWSDEQLKEMKHVYYAMGTELDHYIGGLVDKLKEKNLYEDTLFIFFSDHGDYTGDYEIAEKNQNTFEDCLTNVPLVIKPAKGMEVKPRVTDAMVELIDIQATLLDLLEITPNYTHFGKSLKDVIKGEDKHRDVVFAEGGRLEHEEHCMDAGHSPANEYWARTIEQTKMPHHAKAMMIRNEKYKYVYRLSEQDEFYVLDEDPMERKNQINNAQFSSIIAQFKERMLKHFFETADVVPHRHDKRF
ncbi:sulfatase-like hydrolase/transferase [Neobacillus sp. 3P2-tot-E-2]|uniref:sulfatase-like hydrolase/transferase n=1 Tax=Neobacillus sp. 3P2-tot-E-2 TaxID=3132212 RepID=UPI00399F9318